MGIEIKDRVATQPYWFTLEEVANAGHPQGKKVYSIKPYQFVVEEGTPINKELLQPLVDANDVIDISKNFGTQSKNTKATHCEASVYKVGSVITGTLAFEFDNTTYKADGNLFEINEQYLPICDVIFGDGYGVAGDNAVAPTVVVIGSEVDVIFATNVTAFAVSFTYICKGEIENGDS